MELFINVSFCVYLIGYVLSFISRLRYGFMNLKVQSNSDVLILNSRLLFSVITYSLYYSILWFTDPKSMLTILLCDKRLLRDAVKEQIRRTK